MRLIFATLLALSPLCARADAVVDRVLAEAVLPAVASFASTTQALSEAAKADCTPQSDALLAAWNGAMDAWFGIQDLRFGPLEDGARRQVIAYWPDNAGHRPRALSRILSGQDPILKTPEKYEGESVSARGLYALETMLYDPDFNAYTAADPGCALVQAAAADLANTGAKLQAAWSNDFVETMQSAGSAKNARFFDAAEVRQVIFTALIVSLHFDIEERLGLPMGSFDKPRPLRAEGRLSQRSQRNLELSLAGHEALARAMLPEGKEALGTMEDFERARFMAKNLGDADFASVATPAGRFKLESLQTALTLLRTTANAELSAALDVRMGLNALDGD